MKYLLYLLFLAAPLQAADPVPPIRLPVLPVIPTPTPPTGPTKLPAEVLYVIDSDVPLIVFASPEGVLGIVIESGPLRIRGRFVDGPPGKLETRTFAGKFVVTVEASRSGICELLIIPAGAAKPADVIRRSIETTGPLPPGPLPPGPGPEPPPPSDPLAKAVAAAWAQDTSPDRAKHAGKLADLYTQAARLATAIEIKTTGQLLKILQDGAITLLPPNALIGVRKAIAEYLVSALGSTDAPLTPDLRDRCAAEFLHVGKVLEGLR